MRTRRSLCIVLAAAAAAMLAAVVPPVTALAMPNCNGSIEDPILQSGNLRSASGQVGVYADVEVFNPALCVMGPADQSGSSSFVALYGGVGETFAVGYRKCANNTVTCGPYNSGATYYFYLYSRAGGTCGSFWSTGIVKAPKGNVGSTPTFHDLEVSRWSNGNYYAFIDEVSQYGRSGSTIACWAGGAGVQSIRWQGLTLDPNDQICGTDANHGQFMETQYKTLNGWFAYTQPFSSPCHFNANSSVHRCTWGSTSGSFFNLWDTRA